MVQFCFIFIDRSEEEFEKVPSFSVPEIQKERKHKKANRSILSSSSSNSPDVSSKSAIAGNIIFREKEFNNLLLFFNVLV